MGSRQLGGVLGPPDNYPGDNCCRFFTGPDFGGLHKDICHDGKDDKKEFMGDFNDKTKSFVCGKYTAFEFKRDAFKDKQFGMEQITGAGYMANPNLSVPNENMQWTMNEQISEVILRPYNEQP